MYLLGLLCAMSWSGVHENGLNQLRILAANCSQQLSVSILFLSSFYTVLLPVCLYLSAVMVENNAAGFIAFLILTLFTLAGVFGLQIIVWIAMNWSRSPTVGISLFVNLSVCSLSYALGRQVNAYVEPQKE